ncbi:hypothetical protein F6455_16785 [Proteobacteria bacterium 005FR1]|nr:hypothetical protein [Proteobacteria bacterium 005FR1]
MTESPFAQVDLRLRASRLLTIFLCLTHLLAAIAIWLSAIPAGLAALISAGVLLHLWHSLHAHCFAQAARALRYRDGKWSLLEDEVSQSLLPVGEWLVTSRLLVLQFRRPNGRRLSLVLPPDAAECRELRRLRVLLRFGLSPQ